MDLTKAYTRAEGVRAGRGLDSPGEFRSSSAIPHHKSRISFQQVAGDKRSLSLIIIHIILSIKCY